MNDDEIPYAQRYHRDPVCIHDTGEIVSETCRLRTKNSTLKAKEMLLFPGNKLKRLLLLVNVLKLILPRPRLFLRFWHFSSND